MSPSIFPNTYTQNVVHQNMLQIVFIKYRAKRCKFVATISFIGGGKPLKSIKTFSLYIKTVK
jgi:hypothetical protein